MQQNQFSRRRFLQIAGIGATSAFVLTACPAAAPAPGGQAEGVEAPSQEVLVCTASSPGPSASSWMRRLSL